MVHYHCENICLLTNTTMQAMMQVPLESTSNVCMGEKLWRMAFCQDDSNPNFYVTVGADVN